MIYQFEAAIWAHASEGGAWFFVTVPADVSDGLRSLRGPATGFGSMRIAATVGQTRWRTSVFPHKASGGFLLPIKAEVRRRETLTVGDRPQVTLEVEM
jgi:hypothetical protein